MISTITNLSHNYHILLKSKIGSLLFLISKQFKINDIVMCVA